MIEIDKKIIDLYLNLAYPQEYHFLKELKIDYPSIHGLFRTPPTFYTKKPLHHLSRIELGLCLNQIAYVGLVIAAKNGQIPEVRNSGIKRTLYGDMVIRKVEEKFKRMIDPSEDIHGSLNTKRIFNLERETMVFTTFNFEEGKYTGKLNVVLIKKKIKWKKI
jgi:hypothetical protein